jgi:eukaryotic-like serine/threonine-protein kinase
MAKDSLSALADAVASDRAVDWLEAESSAVDASELEAIRQLRALADLGAVAKSLSPRWGPFELRGEIGRGAFGTVYRAWDSRLGREVALKLLNAGVDLVGSGDAISEARLLARVEHPNIVPVYGADVHDGRVGIWMKLVNGKTLKEILVEQGPFGAEEAAQIGRVLCRALAAVHRKGFVHRDIKAQNVMREVGGEILLMDFGAADLVAESGTGSLRGSPAYLAPEVFDGGPPTARSDIYSLGVLLYHLVSGSFPFDGRSLSELRNNQASARRLELLDERATLPPEFAATISAAIACDPASRIQSAGAFEVALTRLRPVSGLPAKARFSRRSAIMGAALVTTLGLTGTILVREPPYPLVRKNSVAIIPFRNVGENRSDDYLAAGVSEDLAVNLASLKDLTVMHGAATRRYGNSEKDEAEIARELGADAAVFGSVRRDGRRVRVVATLVDARSGQAILSDSFDREFDDLLGSQVSIARRLAIALRGELTTPEYRRVGEHRIGDAEAFALYMRGRYHWALRTEQDLHLAVGYFNDAISREPGYALAFTGLSDAYTALGTYAFLSRREAFPKAAEAAARAVELAPDLAEAHASLGYAQKNRFEWKAAEASLRRAIELKPNYGQAHHAYAILLTQLGRFSEATDSLRRATAIDPTSIAARGALASALLMARRFDESIAQFQLVLREEPGMAVALRGLGITHTHRGDYAAAREAFERAAATVALPGDDLELQADLGYLAAVSGSRSEAVEIVGRLEQRDRQGDNEAAVMIAATYCGLGDAERAVKWLRKASDTQVPELGYLLVDPRWDALRSNNEFKLVLDKVGLGR